MAPSMKTKSSPDDAPQFQNRLGWYSSELTERWYKTKDQLNKEAIRAAKLDSIMRRKAVVSLQKKRHRIGLRSVK